MGADVLRLEVLAIVSLALGCGASLRRAPARHAVVTPAIGDGELHACILRAVAQERFPRVDGEPIQVTYPFVLRAVDSTAPE